MKIDITYSNVMVSALRALQNAHLDNIGMYIDD